MMHQRHSIFFACNIALSACIAAVWAVGLAWKPHHPEPQGIAAVPERAFVVLTTSGLPGSGLEPLTEIEGRGERSGGDAAQPEQNAAIERLRREIRQLQGEIKDELAKIEEDRREWDKMFENNREPELVDEVLEIDSMGKLREHEAEIPSYILKGIKESMLSQAEHRLEARDIILDALAESSVTDEEFQEVEEFFGQLDDFDLGLEMRDYSLEDIPVRLKQDGHIWNLLARAIENQQPELTWREVNSAILEDGLGEFVFTRDDFRQITGYGE